MLDPPSICNITTYEEFVQYLQYFPKIMWDIMQCGKKVEGIRKAILHIVEAERKRKFTARMEECDEIFDRASPLGRHASAMSRVSGSDTRNVSYDSIPEKNRQKENQSLIIFAGGRAGAITVRWGRSIEWQNELAVLKKRAAKIASAVSIPVWANMRQQPLSLYIKEETKEGEKEEGSNRIGFVTNLKTRVVGAIISERQSGGEDEERKMGRSKGTYPYDIVRAFDLGRADDAGGTSARRAEGHKKKCMPEVATGRASGWSRYFSRHQGGDEADFNPGFNSSCLRRIAALRPAGLPGLPLTSTASSLCGSEGGRRYRKGQCGRSWRVESEQDVLGGEDTVTRASITGSNSKLEWRVIAGRSSRLPITGSRFGPLLTRGGEDAEEGSVSCAERK
ncbi:hypothetical protein K438DRAFT_1774820 [Mycena galopus ATCC 62051]|nr:hypothetical protein K438DRAFT_1774820 [Mycena galopus ATCC 62051]